MIRNCIVLAIILILLNISANACWTEYNLQGMIHDTKRLVPDNLNWVLDNYEKSFNAGLSESQFPVKDRNSRIQLIVEASDNAVKAFSTEMSYSKGAMFLGRLTRLISDLHRIPVTTEKLNNPNWSTDYAIFLQKKRGCFRIRWRGDKELPQNRKALEKILQKTIVRIDKISKVLIETLNRENKPVGSYDVRSAPFGAGSIAYSAAVNTMASTWLYVWNKVGGV